MDPLARAMTMWALSSSSKARPKRAGVSLHVDVFDIAGVSIGLMKVMIYRI